MNKREKILAAAAAGVICVIVLFTLINSMFLSPAAALDKALADTAEKLEELELDKAVMVNNKARLKSLATKTYGHEGRIKNAVIKRLMDTLDRSGLSTEGRVIDGGTAKQGKYLHEITWHVAQSGKMEHILNLLYMLEEDPVLHRIENLMIRPREKNGPFSVKFDYIILSLKSQSGPQFTTTRPSDAKIAVNLDSDRRKAYNVIPDRDIFRRYVKRVAPPKRTPTVAAVKKPIHTPPPIPTGPKATYKISALPKFLSGAEVWVTRYVGEDKKLYKYKEGEKLMGWDIVMVDFRPMIHPEKPGIASLSRVIVKIGEEYWAIEGEQYVNDKRMLKDADLPPELKIASRRKVEQP